MKEHFSISSKHYMTVQYKRVGTIYELTQTAKGETETLTVAFFCYIQIVKYKICICKICISISLT